MSVVIHLLHWKAYNFHFHLKVVGTASCLPLQKVIADIDEFPQIVVVGTASCLP